MELSPFKKEIEKHFDALAPRRRSWKARNRYYYEAQTAYLQFLVPEGKRVLELGCGTGELLAAVKPDRGLGIDISGRMVEQARHGFPELIFRKGDAEDPSTWQAEGPFDYILMVDLVGHLEDVQHALERLHAYCTPSTRLIIAYYNFLWEPVLKVAERTGAKMPTKVCNWLSPEDLENLLYLSDFEPIKKERRLLLPKKVPFLSGAIEFVGSLPGINRLCISNYVVARPKEPVRTATDKSVSVVIPCKNEKGNIEPAVKRLPEMGLGTEILFVDGRSSDGTRAEIERVMEVYREKEIRLLVQDGHGKGDAVRKGFDHATGDILVILDADLTVPPEQLPKFYHAIVNDKGELIMGSRLVYPMEDDAMRFLNMLGNKFFSMCFTWLLNQRIKDTLCGTKVLRKTHYEMIAAGRRYFGEFDPFGDFDLLFGASKLNLKITEIPVRYQARRYGETQIRRFRHGLLLLRMCVFGVRKFKLTNIGRRTGRIAKERIRGDHRETL